MYSGGCPAVAGGGGVACISPWPWRPSQRGFMAQSGDLSSPFDGRSIRLLHNVFQPVFFRPMRRNALNRAWTLAWQRLGVGLPWRKFFYSEPGRSSDARFGCAMQQVLGVGGGLKPGRNRALKSRAVSAQAMTVGAVVAIFGKGGGTRAVVAIFCKRR